MKQYNGEKAIISLTTWRARIDTVGLTLFSLIKQCPGFHIVLVLSEEEFPQKEAELPDSVMAFVDQDLIEILWVFKNYRSFKKVLFTMDKYRGLPVISADDDCIYKYNYAKKLYQLWLYNKQQRICYWCSNLGKRIYNTSGYATLHPPYFYGNALMYLTDEVIAMNEDDLLYAALCKLLNKTGCVCLHKDYTEVVYPHDEQEPLHDLYKNTLPASTRFNNLYKIIEDTHLSLQKHAL